MNHKTKNKLIMVILLLLPIAAMVLSFTVGRYAISAGEFLAAVKSVFSAGDDVNNAATVIFQVRLPRILAAMLIGGGLAASGAVLQGLFKNPLVSPDLLGASAGAGFGTAIAILAGLGIAGIQGSAFVWGLGAVAATYTLSKLISRKNQGTLFLILVGIVVSSVFQSLVSLIKYVADPHTKLQTITFWLMGSLNKADLLDVYLMAAVVAACMIPLLLLRYRMNVMSFSDEEAQSMGLDTRKIRVIVILCATLMTSASVSIGGLIGWVGLVIPHVARMLVGSNFKVLLPASFLIGCTYLLLIDDLSRAAVAAEIPLGILTGLIGAPFFIYLIIKGKRGYEQ
ncbi:FecCD family ABC transporter permease [Dehalobacter restrictus]|uniref:Iron chelate uptake ABC transporter family permease subunit n=1 Tax=Dehalobacter restrictus TaxID=55583 RepID=A0A857DG47_9FIRM|nr:iron ABC transporter permease [Dehalobacter restrictus]QGZ99215.1 iron chelate uptake ABC transporter family permease subunit [Dehalobacter restrictus]